MKYFILSSVLLLLFYSCDKKPRQEAILKELFKKEFNYELPNNVAIITLPAETCPGCNMIAKQCYKKVYYKPEVIAVCTDTAQIGYLSGTKRIFWDKNKAITRYQIGQQPYYIEFKDGKVISTLEFSKEKLLCYCKKNRATIKHKNLMMSIFCYVLTKTQFYVIL